MRLFENTAAGKIKYPTLIGIVAVHLLALLAFFPDFFSWWGVGLAVIMSWVTQLGITLGHHRLFTHESYDAKKGLRYALAVCGNLTLEGRLIWWAATHKVHHDESDHVYDPHTPRVSFWWAHMFWTFFQHEALCTEEAIKEQVPRLYADKGLHLIDKLFLPIWIAFALLSFAVGYWIGGFNFGMSLMVWGSFVRTVYVWHATWLVNSATHVWGYQNHKTGDDSRNLWWVAFLTLGEGWHNNHHARRASARFGQKWWEVDVAYGILSLFEKWGWAYRLNRTLTPATKIVQDKLPSAKSRSLSIAESNSVA